jgi:hypothetical protein
MTNRRELALILFFCLAAALRVFIFSAGFPFFSNIDEDLHFDVIMQYSHARLLRSFDLLKEETLEWIVPYASPEFLGDAGSVSRRKISAAIMETASRRGCARIGRDESCVEHRSELRIPPSHRSITLWRVSGGGSGNISD